MKSLLSSDGFFCGFNPNKPLLKNLSKQKAFLTIVSSVFLFSCASYTKSFESRAIPVESFTPDYLKNFEENSFKISIEAYGNHFGGILATKKLSENHFRFAFLNEFGGKMLDFELINQELKLNYAIDELNKKIILNLLKKDFNLLFHENNKVLNAYENNGYMILQSEINKKPVYYYLKNNALEKTVLAGTAKEKIRVQYGQTSTKFPNVEITHGKLKIKIYLHLLDNN